MRTCINFQLSRVLSSACRLDGLILSSGDFLFTCVLSSVYDSSRVFSFCHVGTVLLTYVRSCVCDASGWFNFAVRRLSAHMCAFIYM